MIFDGKGLKCPLAFVKAKQGLMKNKSKEFLFDDDISLYNFTSYLDNQNILYQSIELADCVKIKVVGDKA
jgi:TusA-related sulfurtransferase